MSVRSLSRGIAGGALLLVCGEACDEAGIDTPDLERMIVQERYQTYDPCELFPDGRAMRTPPEDTVAHSPYEITPDIARGVVNGAYVDRIPIPVTRELLARGQDRFQIYCATCHGIAGDGESWVARKMSLRKPPSLIDARVRSFPPGRIYQVIQEGYGLMRSYVEDLDQEDRWAVVGYVQALLVASAVPLSRIPPAQRARAEEELK
jgi:mono/diheme cytochrome c family protein